MSLPTAPPDWPSARFTWRIENFSRLKAKKVYSENFSVEGSKWRVLIFPKGNNTKHLSMYVDVADSETLPYGWSRPAHFRLAVINQLNDDFTIKKETQHLFNQLQSDWGYTYFIPLSELCDPGGGYLLNDTIIVVIDLAVQSHGSKKENGCQEQSQHPSLDSNSGNVEVDFATISGEEVSPIESVQQDLVSTEASSIDKEAEGVPSCLESTYCTSSPGTSPPSQEAIQPISGTQTPSVDASHLGSSETTPVGSTSNIAQAGSHASSGQASDNARGRNIVDFEDAAPAGKVRFLSYWVSSEASLLLERIHGLHKDTFAKFSMKGHILQTLLLESFASFIESMSNTKVHDEEALCLAAISIEDFEQVGLDLSWLKQRLDEAKRVNKRSESLVFVDLCESALKVARAKVQELEESLAKAKAEVEVGSRDLPKSLGVDDSVLKDVV